MGETQITASRARQGPAWPETWLGGGGGGLHYTCICRLYLNFYIFLIDSTKSELIVFTNDDSRLWKLQLIRLPSGGGR